MIGCLRIGFPEENLRAVLAVASEGEDDVEDKLRPKSCLESGNGEEEIALVLVLQMEKVEFLKLIAISMALTLSLSQSRSEERGREGAR